MHIAVGGRTTLVLYINALHAATCVYFMIRLGLESYSIRNRARSDTASVRYCENVPLYLRILTKYTAVLRQSYGIAKDCGSRFIHVSVIQLVQLCGWLHVSFPG
jgi:hypothetical protein